MSDETAVTPAVSEDIFNAVTQIAEVSIDWRSLNGGEIYDRFIQKGAKLGIQANKVIRILKKEGHFNEDDTNTLAKVKKDRLEQREKFVNLSDDGLEVLRNAMHNFANNIEVEEDVKFVVT